MSDKSYTPEISARFYRPGEQHRRRLWWYKRSHLTKGTTMQQGQEQRRAMAMGPALVIGMIFLIHASSVAAQDCGAVTATGQCDGSTVQFCANGQLVQYDCATLFPNNPARCGEVSAEWGFDCLIDTGAECLYSSDGSIVATFCEDEGACVVDLDNATSACVADVGLHCSPDDEGYANNAFCDANNAFFACIEADSFTGLACGFGSTCTNGRCEGVEEDGRCDPAGVSSTCEEGLVCDDNGICRPSELEPEPSGEIDAGCASVRVNTELPGLSLFALAVLLARSRRSRRK